MDTFPTNSGGGIAMTRMVPVFRRRSRRGTIQWINSWLIVLLILGTVIVAADGFSRDPMPEEGTEAATPVLEYQSFWGAGVFALISLPLCYLYARKTGASRGEAILAWFILDTVAYSKDFAYIRLPGLPLFVTDIVLALFLWSFFRSMGLRFLHSDRWWGRLVLAFLAVGAVSVERGIAGHQDTLLIARDAAIVVYSLFIFVGFHVVTTWEGVRRFFIALAVGSIFATLNGLAWFLAQPDQRRFIAYGVFVLASFAGTLVFTINRMIKPVLGWSLALILFVGILLINARTVFLGVGIAVLVMMLSTPSGKFRIGLRSLRLAAGVAVGAGLRIVGGKRNQGRSGIRGSGRDPACFRYAELRRRPQCHFSIDGMVRGFPAIQRKSRPRGGIRYSVHIQPRRHRCASPQYLFDRALQDGSARTRAAARIAHRLPLEWLEGPPALDLAAGSVGAVCLAAGTVVDVPFRRVESVARESLSRLYFLADRRDRTENDLCAAGGSEASNLYS